MANEVCLTKVLPSPERFCNFSASQGLLLFCPPESMETMMSEGSFHFVINGLDLDIPSVVI
jgi:hypothetical protein